MAKLDRNRVVALFWLAVTFWVHVFHRLRARFVEPPARTPLETFGDNYRADGIWRLDASARAMLPDLGECVTCRLCDSVCPSMHAEAGRGFVGPSRLVMANERLLPAVSTWIDPFLCVRCRACDDACPQGVPVDRMVGLMRDAVAREAPALVPPEYAAAARRAVEAGHVTGAAPGAPRRGEGAHDVTYVPGCACAAADVAAEAALLERAGVDFGSAPARCCGGFGGALPEGAERALPDALRDLRALTVVTADARCYAHMKRDARYKDVVVRHVLDLAGELRGGREPEDAPRVTYHDPCALVRTAGGAELPREAIRRAGGELVEMGRHGRDAPCCGMGGGTHTFAPDLAEELGRARVREAAATGAKVLLTQSPLCRDHLARCAALEKTALEVRNVTEFLAARLATPPAAKAPAAAPPAKAASARFAKGASDAKPLPLERTPALEKSPPLAAEKAATPPPAAKAATPPPASKGAAGPGPANGSSEVAPPAAPAAAPADAPDAAERPKA